MRLAILSAAAAVTMFSTQGSAFTTTFQSSVTVPGRHQRQHGTQQLVLHAMADRDEEALAQARNDVRTDVRNLLTQRAIQSFMFLSDSLRDPHSVKWIEEFLETPNQLSFHGTGAGYFERFGGTWDAPLFEMIARPKDVIVVSAKRRGRGHGGWSKDNPYLEERWVEFNIDIDPASLATRILSVREQIAKEWETDLTLLESANQQILESYFKLAREERAKKDDQLAVTPMAFERTVVNIINQQISITSGATSPFRKGNFDLLYNLCTQESVHRLLRDLAGDSRGGKEISFAWLRDFYVDRVADYFDGDQKYGRADDFIEDLLLSSPSVVYTDDGKVGLADPMGLAEQIITKRSEIVQEWKVLMQNTPQDHADGIRKVLLSKQMEAWGSSTPLGGGGGTSGFQ